MLDRRGAEEPVLPKETIVNGRRKVLSLGLGGALAVVSSGRVAWAQAQWPSRPIRILVPYAPGGLTDNLARLLADRLRTMAPEGVVVENRPGAGTLLAASQVARAPADGYTLLMATSTTLGISQSLFAKPMIQVGDLAGIGMMGAVTLFLVVRPDFPAATVPELVAELKARPGQHAFASPGNGTPHHLLSEMLKTRAGVTAMHVPYNGSVQALTDLLSGQVQLLILDASVALPQIQAGKLRALATTAPKRSSLAPDVPSLTEYFPDMTLQVWQGVVGPNDLPRGVVQRLNEEIDAALAAPEFRTKLVAMGLEPLPMSVEQFNAMIREQAPRWGELVKQSGARVD